MRKKRILLYYPILNQLNEARFYHWFPYSVLPLAQSLEKAGYHVEIIDRRVQKELFSELSINLDDVLFVGISVMTGYQLIDGLSIAKRIRELRDDIKIVWGGWHPTILLDETIENPFVDIAVSGRAEAVIIQIANAIQNSHELKNIDGIAYKYNGKIIRTKPRAPTDIIDDVQSYERFIDIKKYVDKSDAKVGYFSSHGCVYKCAFCCRNLMSNRCQFTETEKVIDDLKYFKQKHNCSFVYFHDDNFFIYKNRVFDIADQLIKANLNIGWWANVRANIFPTMSESEIDILLKAGLKSIYIGVESGSQEILQLVNKGIKVDDIYKTLERLSKYDIKIELSYMLGLPGDNIDKLKATISQIYELLEINNRLSFIDFCFFQPYPGTSLYNESLKWGYPQLKGFEEWGNLGTQSELQQIPWLSDQEMKQYKLIYKNFLLDIKSKINLPPSIMQWIKHTTEI